MNVRGIGSIARYTVVQNFRNKTFYVLILFAAIMFVASFIFSSLGVEQEIRLIFDLGNGCIEVFGLILAVFFAVTMVIEEIDSRTIYLILSRPVQRYQYLLGRYIGLLTATALTVLIMHGLHFGYLLFKGWEFDINYFLIVLMTLEKIAIISSIALFFSIFSSSAASSIVFTFFFWVLGHFSVELQFLGERLTAVMPRIAMKIGYYIIPHLYYFNIREQWNLPQYTINLSGFVTAYTILYTVIVTGLSVVLFKRKEF